MRYWLEALESSLDEHCIGGAFVLTKDQREAVAKDLEFAAQMESEAAGRINIPDPRLREIDTLEKALKTERDKVHCKECGGTGTITSYGPCHSATSQCWKCRGEGRHAR